MPNTYSAILFSAIGAIAVFGLSTQAPIVDPSPIQIYSEIQLESPLGQDCGEIVKSRSFSSYHNGLDLPKEGGCTIRASASGTVERAEWSSNGEGYMVILDHGNDIKTEYHHGSGEFYVITGDQVNQGDPIMEMGSTGNSTGTHLHFEVIYNGVNLDPEDYI